MDSKKKKQLAKQRKENAKQAQKYHKEQEKQNKKSSESSIKADESKGKSKIKDAVSRRRAKRRLDSDENLSREEKFRREGEEKIRNLQPQDYEEGYFIDEYAEKQRQEKRAKEIRKQEKEVISRSKKPMTRKQIRLKRILISSGIFAAVIIIGVVLSLTVLFKIEKIEVEGDVYYEEDQIVAFSNVASGQNIFISSWNSTPEEIVKNLPFIESADVSVSIPDTVTIKVTNAVPTYAVKCPEGYLVVSSKGRILDITDKKSDELIELKCGEIKQSKKGEYLDLGDESAPEVLNSVAKSFEANGVDKITGFDVTNLSAIIINYDNRIDINIGLPEDIDYKIRTAFTIINEKLDPNKTGMVAGTLDVSTCNKNKMSRYKPSETQPTTVPSTTAPVNNGGAVNNGGGAADNGGDAYYNGGYTNEYYGGGAYDNGGYTDEYYGGGAYDNGGYTDEYYGDGAYNNGGYTDEYYGDGAYNNGGDAYDNGGDVEYDWQPYEG